MLGPEIQALLKNIFGMKTPKGSNEEERLIPASQREKKQASNEQTKSISVWPTAPFYIISHRALRIESPISSLC